MSKDMVEIGCRIPNGINLRVSDWIKGPTGQEELREVGMYQLAGSGQHVAAPGLLGGKDDATFTKIPADMWAAWLKMNERTDLHTSGAVFERGKDPMAEPDAEAAAAGEGDQGQDTGLGAGTGGGSAGAAAPRAPAKGRGRKAAASGADAGKSTPAGQPAGGSAGQGSDSLTGSSGADSVGGAGSGPDTASGSGADTGMGAGSETLPGSGQDSGRGAGSDGQDTVPGAGLSGA